MISWKNSLNKSCLLAGAALCLTACSVSLPKGAGRQAVLPTVAVMPVSNLTAASAPAKDVRQDLIRALTKQGATVLDDQSLEQFMARHRLRYTSGIDAETGRALKEETGTDAVLITSVEAAGSKVPPRFALASRLVSTGSEPAILWSDSRALAGDDAPGFLGLGLIEHPRELREQAVRSLAGSLVSALSGTPALAPPVPSSFRPRRIFRSTALDGGRTYRVAVIPFRNRTEQEHAGEIVALEFIAAMTPFPRHFEVIEPGIVRSKMLRYRLIMEQGLSLADADVLFEVLQADLILTGTVYTYEDDQGMNGSPRIGMSPVILERESRSIAWSSSSYNEGDDNVYFFDIGKVSTAAAMAGLTSRATVQAMVKRNIGRIAPAQQKDRRTSAREIEPSTL